jgi:hypothetical protein
MKTKIKYTAPLVPEKCLVCGKNWKSGEEKPGERMKVKSDIVYDCGCIMSVKRDKDNSFKIKIQDCWCDDNLKVISDEGIHKPNRMSLNVPFEQDKYFVIIQEDHIGYSTTAAIDVDKNEVDLHYGDSILPLFTSKEKALDYIQTWEGVDPEDCSVTLMKLKTIAREEADYFSHAIVDPVRFENGEIDCSDEKLSDLTKVEV